MLRRRPATLVSKMSANREIVEASAAPAAIGPYSHAVLVDLRSEGALLFCSGQIPLDPATGELTAPPPQSRRAGVSRTSARSARRRARRSNGLFA